MSQLLLTGVAGVVGKRTLPALANNSVVSRIVGIDTVSLIATSNKLQFVKGDLRCVDLDALLVDIDVVVHLANTADMVSVRKLFAAINRAKVKHLVVVSSAAVYGAWPNNAVPLTENCAVRPNPGFEFAVNLAETERLAQLWRSQHSDVVLTVLRMSMILGAGLNRAMTDTLGGMRLHPAMDRDRPIQFLHIDDAVTAISLAVDRSLDGTYNVGPNNFIADTKARAVAGVARQIRLPRLAAFYANDFLSRRRYKKGFGPTAAYLHHPWVVSNDALRAEGWEPTYTTEEALVVSEKPTRWERVSATQRREWITASFFTLPASIAALTILIVWIFFKKRSGQHPS